ncbi:MAG: NAD(P)/FAD-dependent oxidoreductase [Bacteroidetes bacterium]|nr:NAD(P)/FAD-dependent oxidoreductase [Bacteroidota bacterium]
MSTAHTHTLVVIGGGAAGFFAAVNAARLNPALRVVLLEKTDKLLSKVRVSGGGRCNVTHACFDNRELAQRYPRGSRELLSAFSRFSVSETIGWFAARGVELKVEDDGRMFPITDNSETIAACLLREAEATGVEIKRKTEVHQIEHTDAGFALHIAGGGTIHAQQLIVAAGGHAKASAYAFLQQTGHSLVPPVPSLFTFNMPGNPVTQLMGVSSQHAVVTAKDTVLHEEGPVLITHWGMSGPAVLRTSAWGARLLADKQYKFTARLSWLPAHSHESLTEWLRLQRTTQPRQLIRNGIPHPLPRRLWEFLLAKCGIPDNHTWADMSNTQLRTLTGVLLSDEYPVSGKTTFKEEFVTAGGVALHEIDFKTMQSRRISGLYFAGEVLDIDGITGGFNFQAAWTTAWIAACAAAGVPVNSALD